MNMCICIIYIQYINIDININTYIVIGSASPDPDNSPKRRQLLRNFSQCHQQERLIQLRSQAWKGGEDSPQTPSLKIP